MLHFCRVRLLVEDHAMPVTVLGPIFAVFEDRGQAESAIDELRHAGFREDQLGMATPGGSVQPASTPITRREDRAATGAATGAVAGGVTGAVGGALVAAFIPGIGPILAGGFLAGILAGTVGGAAAGAALGGWIGPFLALGASEEDVRRYGINLQAGHTILVVKPENRREEAERIVRDHGGR
jgi:hypothetical protein